MTVFYRISVILFLLLIIVFSLTGHPEKAEKALFWTMFMVLLNIENEIRSLRNTRSEPP